MLSRPSTTVTHDRSTMLKHTDSGASPSAETVSYTRMLLSNIAIGSNTVRKYQNLHLDFAKPSQLHMGVMHCRRDQRMLNRQNMKICQTQILS